MNLNRVNLHRHTRAVLTRHQTRSLWSPRLLFTATKVASRTALAAGGTTIATAAYFGHQLKEWGEDKRDKLANFIQAVDFSSLDSFTSSFKNLVVIAAPKVPKVQNDPISPAAQAAANNGSFASSTSNLPPRIVDDQFMLLTRRLIEVRNILKLVQKDDALKLPSIVVVGSQSSGKSSLLEAIVGHDFLPKGNNMVTRRPVEITLINSPESTEEYADFPRQGISGVRDFTRVAKILTDLNSSVSESECISEDPIDLRIYSPNVPDLTLIDLPGYIAVHSRNQPAILKQKIVNLCRKYIQEPNIILAVCAADVDLANSEALNESRQVDPYGKRTVGVLTKMDLVKPERAVELLKNEEFPLHLGYYGVISKDLNSEMTSDFEKYQRIIGREEQYFREHSEIFSPFSARLGIPTLKRVLVRVLQENMSKSLSKITQNVRTELDEARYQFKVEFSDRRTSPETYTAEVIDQLKQDIRGLSMRYSRPGLREEIQKLLDELVVSLCDQFYWSEYLDEPTVGKVTSSFEEEEKQKLGTLERAQNQFTRFGLGKLTASHVIDSLFKSIQDLALKAPLSFHEDAAKSLTQIAENLLKNRVAQTVDQVENSLKPYKYDVDFTAAEWHKALHHSNKLMERELAKTSQSFEELKKAVGWKKLRSAMQYIEKQQQHPAYDKKDEVPFNAKLLAKAQEARLLQKKADYLKKRLSEYQSVWWWPYATKCATMDAAKLQEQGVAKCVYDCPEPYLFLLSEKMAQTIVMFVWIELLSDFFHQFPREIDNRLYYNLDKKQLLEFASENPTIRQHILVQEKKEALESAMEKLVSIMALRGGSF